MNILVMFIQLLLIILSISFVHCHDIVVDSNMKKHELENWNNGFNIINSSENETNSGTKRKNLYEELDQLTKIITFIFLIITFLLLPIIIIWLMGKEARKLLQASKLMSALKASKSRPSVRDTSASQTSTTTLKSSQKLFSTKVKQAKSIDYKLKRSIPSKLDSNVDTSSSR